MEFAFCTLAQCFQRGTRSSNGIRHSEMRELKMISWDEDVFLDKLRTK